MVNITQTWCSREKEICYFFSPYHPRKIMEPHKGFLTPHSSECVYFLICILHFKNISYLSIDSTECPLILSRYKTEIKRKMQLLQSPKHSKMLCANIQIATLRRFLTSWSFRSAALKDIGHFATGVLSIKHSA